MHVWGHPCLWSDWAIIRCRLAHYHIAVVANKYPWPATHSHDWIMCANYEYWHESKIHIIYTNIIATTDHWNLKTSAVWGRWQTAHSGRPWCPFSMQYLYFCCNGYARSIRGLWLLLCIRILEYGPVYGTDRIPVITPWRIVLVERFWKDSTNVEMFEKGDAVPINCECFRKLSIWSGSRVMLDKRFIPLDTCAKALEYCEKLLVPQNMYQLLEKLLN